MSVPTILASHGGADFHLDTSTLVIGVVLLAAAGAGFYLWWRRSHPKQP